MKKIKLNFIPLSLQDQNITVYRKTAVSSSEKADSDYRVNLPKTAEEKVWQLHDVSILEKDGYEEFSCNLHLNPVLSVYILYTSFLNRLTNNGFQQNYYFPQKRISSKEIRFIVNEFKEGNSEIIVQPYYLKDSKLLGFLLEHRFRLNEGQLFNRETQILSYSLDRSGKPNVYYYKDKKREIDHFVKKTFSPLLLKSSLALCVDLADVPTDNLALKSYTVGHSKTAKSQFLGIKSNGPYRKIEGTARYLFVFSEQTKSLARDIYLGLVGKLFPGQFSGLNRMFALPIHKDIVDHHLVQQFDANSIQSIENKIYSIKEEHPHDKIIIIVVLPRGLKGVKAAFDAYGYLKLLALRKSVYCQVITEDTFFKKDQLKWSISNIGLQVFSKLGGAPWLVKPAKSNCLIFGIGSVQEKKDGKISKYTAYTVCLDSSGDFKYIKPLSSSSDENFYLDSLKINLKEVLSSELGEHYKSLVLHLPYKISRNEIQVVKDVVDSLRKGDFEVIVIRINTQHKFLGFSEHNTCVPYESTFVRLSNNEFLIWAEGLQYGKEVLHKRVSEPLYVNFLESQEDWTTKKDCLQDILNLTGANWRGFNSKAQPISILYSRLIAKFMKEFSHLEKVNDMSIVSAEAVAPWFL